MFAKLKSVLLPPALVVIGLGLAYGGFTEGRNFKAIADHGKVVEASVDRVTWKEKAVSGREKGFKIEVHFETEAKQAVQATLSVSKAEGQRFRDTDASSVTIKYLPEAPSTVILADAKDESGVMMIAGGVLALVGAGIFVYRRKKKAAHGAEPVAA
jgi:LPXTG-motif cell wall-anchored protein